MVLATALISLLSIYTTYYVVNSFVENALKQYNINLKGNGLNLTQLLGGLSKAGKIDSDQGSSQAQLDGGDVNPNAAADATNTTGEQHDGTSDKQGEGIAEGETPGLGTTDEETSIPVEGSTSDPFDQDAVEVWNQSSGNSQQSTEGRKDIVMSPEELQQKKDQMGDADKMEVFSILTTKLPQEEVQKISLFIENGITEQELEEVKTILAKYLKDDEYEKLLNILQKH